MKRNGYEILCVIILSILLVLSADGCSRKKHKNSAVKSPSPSPSPQGELYDNGDIGYSITIPEGWKTPEGVLVGELYKEYKNATFDPKPSFNIVSSKVKRYDLKDPSMQREIKDEIEKGLICATERNTTIAGETAYQLIYGVEREKTSIFIYQTYIFHKDYLIVLTGGCKEDKFPIYAPDFEKFLQSLRLM